MRSGSRIGRSGALIEASDALIEWRNALTFATDAVRDARGVLMTPTGEVKDSLCGQFCDWCALILECCGRTKRSSDGVALRRGRLDRSCGPVDRIEGGIVVTTIGIGATCER